MKTEIIQIGDHEYELRLWSGARLVRVRVVLRDGYAAITPGVAKVFVDEEEAGGTIVLSSAATVDGLISHVLSEADRVYPDPNPSITQSPRWMALYPDTSFVR